MRIVVLDGYTENPGDLSWKGLEDLGDLTVYDRTPKDRVVERIGRAEAVYTNKTPISARTIESCPNLRFIGVLATGYNIVDIHAAGDAGVIVSNIPSYGTDAVAQYAIALLLELCHHVGFHSDCVRAGGMDPLQGLVFLEAPADRAGGKTSCGNASGSERMGRRTWRCRRPGSGYECCAGLLDRCHPRTAVRRRTAAGTQTWKSCCPALM
ncbi:MAG: hypothetical protein ACLTW9_06565 [Enterocloster sp.]